MRCEIPNFGRCCFCLPLRQGVLTFGYLNIIFSAFMIGVYAYAINTGSRYYNLLYHGVVSDFSAEICIVIYCTEIIFNFILLYGAHLNRILHVKIFYYYGIATIVAAALIQIVEFVNTAYFMALALELAALSFAGLSIQLYLIILVKSLLKKLEMSEPHLFENQLHQIISGERKFESNGIYNTNTVVPIEDI